VTWRPRRGQFHRVDRAKAEAAPTESGKPEDRCAERACAYPSRRPGGWCRYHWLLFTGRLKDKPHTEVNVTMGRGWE
jgi:hypothetical protein